MHLRFNLPYPKLFFWTLVVLITVLLPVGVFFLVYYGGWQMFLLFMLVLLSVRINITVKWKDAKDDSDAST